MIKEHPTEEQLQAYAMEPVSGTDQVRQHIDLCAECQRSVRMYSALFSALREQPDPVFDFDVTKLVLSTLPSSKKKRLHLPYLLIVLLVIIMGIPIYLFKENIANLFSGLSQFFIYACAGSAAIFVVMRAVQIVKTYRARFNMLNHFPDLQP